MKRARLFALAMLLPLLAPLGATGQRAPVQGQAGPPHFSFDADLEGWMSPNDTGLLSICTELDGVKVGEGSLQFDYTPLGGEMAAIAAGPLALSQAQSLSFWLKCTETTVFAIALAEADEDEYVLPVFVPADQWVRVEAAFSDFRLSEEDVDENGRLDPNEVAACFLVDVACFLLAEGEEAQFLFPYMSDLPRIMWMDDLVFSSDPVVPHRGPRDLAGERQVLLDDFQGGFLRWLPVQQGDPQVAAEGYVSLEYELGKAQVPLAGLITMTSGEGLENAVAVHVRVGAEHDLKLGLTIEERGDARYMAPVDVPGGEWQDVRVPLADFNLDDETTDDNGTLDPGQMKMFGLVDLGALLGGYTGPQRLLVDEVAFVLGN
ncbi:MAG: hypothetical protein ACE5R4_01795 [Armatimonadota bacterium]